VIDPKTITPTQLPSVPLESRAMLPKTPGIYFAIDSQGTIQYIGRSVDINQRWKQHHRCDQLEKVGEVQIAWLEVSDTRLLSPIEKALIKWFRPPLNSEPLPSPKLPTSSDSKTQGRIRNAIRKLLMENDISAYQFWKETQIGQKTAYRLCSDPESIPSKRIMKDERQPRRAFFFRIFDSVGVSGAS